MLDFENISSSYPPIYRGKEKLIIQEYLQFLILNIIFKSKYSPKLSFIGGTALRIIYNNNRFSEDLDFDNFGLLKTEFENLSIIIKRELSLLGFSVEMRTIYKMAYHCVIKIPKYLYESNLSPMADEKITLLIDTVTHDYKYQPDKKSINKFGVSRIINVTPKNLILAQKIYAIFNRNIPKGRDFYDFIFLVSLGAKFDYKYLKQKIGIAKPDELKKRLVEKCEELDFKLLAKDVERFLVDIRDRDNIIHFKQFLESIKF